MITRQHLLALLVLLPALAVPAAQSQRAGLITALRGDVSVLRPGKEPKKPKIKESIFEGDTIKTGKRGRVQVCFEDDSIVSIGRKATLVVTKHLYDPSAKKGAMKIEVKEGFFRVLGGAVTRIAPENFETVAGTASIGIRGCSFGGEVIDGVATLVFFGSNVGGEIGVTGGGVRRPVVTPGNGVTVPRGGPPSMPSPMERFGVRILRETQPPAAGGGDDDGQGSPPPGARVVDPTKTLGVDLQSLLPWNGWLNGFVIGEELETGWLYRNGSPELLHLQLATTVGGDLLNSVEEGAMITSVHSNANFVAGRDDNFLLPILGFEIADGAISDGIDLFGNTIVAVTDSAIEPAPELKSYMNWGKWEMTIVDPNSLVRRSRTVRGLWLGTDLPRDDLTALHDQAGNLVLGGDFQGTYSGFSHCLKNGTVGFDGTSQYDVDFRSGTFTGQFNFATDSGPNMTFAGNLNTDGTVQGTCTNVSGESVIQSSSIIEGALYNNAKVIGTSWNAKTTTNSYIGVGAGTGTVTPSASSSD